MEIIWRNPAEELPECGDVVWAMLLPHKEGIQSVAIVCGEVEHYDDVYFVHNNDELGVGNQTWYLTDTNDIDRDVLAWLPVHEMPIPPWHESE